MCLPGNEPRHDRVFPHPPAQFRARAEGFSSALVTASNPAAPGEVVVIYATGLGPVSPAPATGQSAPAVPPLALVTTPVKVTIGGVEAAVEFAGLAPGLVGVYQVNAQVPQEVTPGNEVDVVMTQGGAQSNTVTIAVQ